MSAAAPILDRLAGALREDGGLLADALTGVTDGDEHLGIAAAQGR
ncbi:MAG: hypothetical protein JWQ18_257, partial [Conexibacter sp.]|nr:hypothetical protein [Conexibacter sp.]